MPTAAAIIHEMTQAAADSSCAPHQCKAGAVAMDIDMRPTSTPIAASATCWWPVWRRYDWCVPTGGFTLFPSPWGTATDFALLPSRSHKLLIVPGNVFAAAHALPHSYPPPTATIDARHRALRKLGRFGGSCRANKGEWSNLQRQRPFSQRPTHPTKGVAMSTNICDIK